MTPDRGTRQDDARHSPTTPSSQVGKGGEGAVSDGEGVNDVASREGAGRDCHVRDIKLVVPQVCYKHVICVAFFRYIVRFF